MLSVSKQLFEKIQAVCEAGFSVLIYEDDIYVCTKFEHSVSGTAAPIDFNTAKVLCLTDFMLNTQIAELMNKKTFQNKLVSKIDSMTDPIVIKFNKYLPYALYSKF